MQAIRTRYQGPTTKRGARITAKCEAGMLTVAWDYDSGIDGNHANAAQQLAAKLGWTKEAGYTGLLGGGRVRQRLLLGLQCAPDAFHASLQHDTFSR